MGINITNKQQNWLYVCRDNELQEKHFLIIALNYRGKPHSGIIFRFNGNTLAYLNQCVHMPRQLNCESNAIFDKQQNLLRCSMHGIVFDPFSGESLSTMCKDEKLIKLQLKTIDDEIFISDKHCAEINGVI